MSNPQSKTINQPTQKNNKSPESKVKDMYQQLMEEGQQVLDNIDLANSEPVFAFQKERQLSAPLPTQNISQANMTQRYQLASEENGKEHAAEDESKREPSDNLQQMVKKSSKIFGCNCLKSKCTKNYCECFTQGRKCNELCKCTGCENQGEVQKRYRPNIEVQEGERFCNCKKSNCLKKYCECYNSGMKCNSNCKCQECKNRDDAGNGEVEEMKQEIKRQKSQKQIEEINARIDELSKMVPKEHQQYLLSFLDYWLS